MTEPLDQNTAQKVITAVGWFRYFFKGTLSVALLGHVIIFKFVIPRFVEAYAGAGLELPAVTQFLINQSTYWVVYLVFALANIVLLFTWKFFDDFLVLLIETFLIGAWTAYVYIAMILPYFSLIDQLG